MRIVSALLGLGCTNQLVARITFVREPLLAQSANNVHIVEVRLQGAVCASAWTFFSYKFSFVPVGESLMCVCLPSPSGRASTPLQPWAALQLEALHIHTMVA